MRKPIIKDEKIFEEKKQSFRTAGFEKIYIMSDFDNTLTREYIDGEHTPSLIAELSRGEYISKRHAQEDKRMFAKYRPIEIDPTLTKEEKSAAMFNWWDEHMQVMIEEGAKKEMFIAAAENSHHQFRQYVYELFEYTKEHTLPFVIFSAGYGEMIQALLDSIHVPTDHAFVVSNELEFDEEGFVRGYAKEKIQIFNKNTIGPDRVAGLTEELEGRTHVIVMGDGLGDLPMMEKFPHTDVIKIGFYNHLDDSLLEHHVNGFDVVIPDDGDMSFVLELLEKFR